MQTLNYWKQFEHTGKVEDYLSYKSYVGMNAAKGALKPVEGLHRMEERGRTGADSHAGIYMGNRNDIETDAYRGI